MQFQSCNRGEDRLQIMTNILIRFLKQNYSVASEDLEYIL